MGHEDAPESFKTPEERCGQTICVEFHPSYVLVRRPGVRPLRQPVRRDAVSMRLFEALVAGDGEDREPGNPSCCWVAKDELLLLVNPDAVDRIDSFKKALRSLRKFLSTHDLGTVITSGDGLYAYYPPPDARLTVSRSARRNFPLCGS